MMAVFDCGRVCPLAPSKHSMPHASSTPYPALQSKKFTIRLASHQFLRGTNRGILIFPTGLAVQFQIGDIGDKDMHSLFGLLWPPVLH